MDTEENFKYVKLGKNGTLDMTDIIGIAWALEGIWTLGGKSKYKNLAQTVLWSQDDGAMCVRAFKGWYLCHGSIRCRYDGTDTIVDRNVS